MPLDFPNTPTDGDIFNGAGVSWRWDGTKWTSVLSVGGPFLPLAGGDMSGPLNYMATGGTTKRSAQDRSADVANVLDYGADPTGVADSSGAINKAAMQTNGVSGRRKAVYLPTGTYTVTKQLLLSAGQTLRGDGESATIIQVFDNFDPAATSIILCTGGVVDPGPTIRDLMVCCYQPQDVASRSTFKTLAAGGTSAVGGTGVQYPWAIATEGNCGRIQVRNVSIQGAWNGINADGACYWIDGLKICAFNINIAIGGTAAAPVADWAHLSDIEFWPFGQNSPGLQAIWNDGQTFAMRIGCQNGLTAQNISCFNSRIVFTPDAVGGWFSFTNLGMDADQATIEINQCYFLQIANLYTTAGTTTPRPAVTFSAGRTLSIANWYGHNGSLFNIYRQTGGADASITGGYLLESNPAATAVFVNGGTLRLSNVPVYAASPTRTQPLIAQFNTGVLQVNGVSIGSDAPSGTGVWFDQDNVGNLLGFVSLPTGWTNATGGRSNGQYGPWASSQSPTFYGNVTFAGSVLGMSFGAAVGSSVTDTSKHLTLHNAGFGIGVTNGRINYVAAGAAAHVFNVNGADRFSVSDTAAALSVRLAAPGLSFGAVMSGDALDVSHHLEFYTGFAGISVTSGQVNFVCGGKVALAMTNSGSGVGLPALLGSPSYANDAAAAAGGVLPGFSYRNGSVVQIRVT